VRERVLTCRQCLQEQQRGCCARTPAMTCSPTRHSMRIRHLGARRAVDHMMTRVNFSCLVCVEQQSCNMIRHITAASDCGGATTASARVTAAHVSALNPPPPPLLPPPLASTGQHRAGPLPYIGGLVGGWVLDRHLGKRAAKKVVKSYEDDRKVGTQRLLHRAAVADALADTRVTARACAVTAAHHVVSQWCHRLIKQRHCRRSYSTPLM
jgi:hypothetical protein